MANQVLPPVSWQLARLPAADSPAEKWIPAQVPGAVQLDWARAHDFPPLAYGENVRAYDGLEDSFWLYRTTVPTAALAAGERLLMRGDGLDYHAEFRLEGSVVLTHTGLGTPFELDLTDSPGARLEVLIHPAPKRPGAEVGRSQASHVTKPAVSYGWDWHPFLVPLGLSEEVRFEVRPAAYLLHVDFAYELAEDFSEARITVSVEAYAPSDTPEDGRGYNEFSWTLRDPDGSVVLSADSPQATLPTPRLWWTHDHGEPALYTLEVRLGADSWSRKVGFRRVRLVIHEGGWVYPQAFPKSRSHPPITLELNGRRIFARGSNWVNPEIFPGLINAETYRPLLELARDAHFNILRNWGGAACPKEPFFEQCDDLGILVWQEFPLGCNAYPDWPEYLADLDRESRAMIRRVRQHPSLALWCGGNELFNSWSRMDDQSHALRLLNRNCFDLDRHTPFLPTSPVDGMGHGDYRFRDDDGREIYQIFQQSNNTAYTEFGCPGPSPVAYLREFIPEGELWPPRPGGSWEMHHAFHAWSPDPRYWLNERAITHYFGESASLEELVARGEWLQCEGYKAAFEEARRQAPSCAMALNWCFNEPWPTAANNSLLNYPALPKPAFYAVQAACRPSMTSARLPKFQWAEGELFTAEIWLLNDAPLPHDSGELIATLDCGGVATELLRWTFPGLTALRHLAGPSVRIKLPRTTAAAEFTLRLEVSGRPEWTSEYRLSLKSKSARAVSGPPALNM